MDVRTVFLGFSVYVACAWGSLFNPHLFPNTGPFFEGWYLRITDFDTSDSIGILFGRVLPESGKNVTGPLVLASILRRTACVKGNCTLISYNANFDVSQLTVRANGMPVDKNPDASSPANFSWVVNSGEQGVVFQQLGNVTTFSVRIENMLLHGETGPAVPWQDGGDGPEGWLVNLPLPIHWFVFSLRSPIHYYELQDTESGTVTKGTHGAVHMEKNWGQSFPESWIWAEGVSQNDKNNISFALSGGLVDFSLMSVNAFLIGFRNPGLGVAIDFRPDNSMVSTQIDGCKGQVNITARSISYKLEISLSSGSSAFSKCLYGPEASGFQRACVESYDATATIVLSKSAWFMSYVTLDQLTISKVALEFGGTHVCGNKCS